MTNKTCPRCGKKFVCMHEFPSRCQCASVDLTDADRRKIASLYSDCLCARCLEELKEK